MTRPLLKMESEEKEHEGSDHEGFEDANEVQPKRELPSDLPRSLDDRKALPSYGQETEYYDAWQGQ